MRHPGVRFFCLLGALALAAACAPPTVKTGVGRTNVKASGEPEAATPSPSATPTARGATAAPGGTPAPAGPTATPAAESSAAATTFPTPEGAPRLQVDSDFAAERPSALVNYDTGEIVWSPAQAVMTWKVTALGTLELGKARVTFGTSTTLDGGPTAAPTGEATAAAEPSIPPNPYGLLQDVPLPSNPAEGPTLDPSFVPPTTAPRPTPLASVGGFDPVDGAALGTFELTLDKLGLPSKLDHGQTRTVTLTLTAGEVEGFIRAKKPLNSVEVEILLLDATNAPVMEAQRPALLSGQVRIK